MILQDHRQSRIYPENSTDDNDDSFLGPNWTFHNAVLNRGGKRPFPWGSSNPNPDNSSSTANNTFSENFEFEIDHKT